MYYIKCKKISPLASWLSTRWGGVGGRAAIIVRGRKVTINIDGKTVIEYNEPPVDPTGRGKKSGEGTFALQAHDPKSIIHYKSIRVKRLE